jgi:predicted glycogen debranching enzyme
MAHTQRTGWSRTVDSSESLLSREWLVTNGLGGYASGTICGAPTRRYHGLLIAALPNPFGRTMLLNQLSERMRLPDGRELHFGGYERGDRLELQGAEHLREFRLEDGLPVWVYELGAFVVEKRLWLGYLQNTVYVHYAVTEGDGALVLGLRPTFHFRGHDAPVSLPVGSHYTLSVCADRYEVIAPALPPLRLTLHGSAQRFVCETHKETHITYRVEAARGYDWAGEQWSLGHFRTTIDRQHPATLIASAETWEDLTALNPGEAREFEAERRARLIALATEPASDAIERELALAADQFVIAPRGRVAATTRAHARGDELRSVIAGYHWFTDWGRDTMISLEGLTLQTGRHDEARWILRMFAQHLRQGLIPNLFPEGAHEGLYHTADATLWFFHALDRYLHYTQDSQTLRELLPALQGIVAWQVRGTQFGIGMDARDALLRQGQDGYQLTWMDAKCGDWVVTPRRGKAVEINALWYNALRKLSQWLSQEQHARAGAEIAELANRTQRSFNARFWSADLGYLYDVVDADGGDDSALRPNQLFAISLPEPVLARAHWAPVLDAVSRALLTPVGLRSLAPSSPDYKPTYQGDLLTRDAAYHQGTVWSWLIGPYVDAWLRVHPDERSRARECLSGLVAHLGEAGVGSVSEVFDAEAPFAARGCIAQAWGVAEVLRAYRLTAP